MLATVRAATARGLHPRRADPIARPSCMHARAHFDDFPDHFVAGRLRINVASVALRGPYVRVAHPGRMNLHQHLPRPGLRNRHFPDFPGPIGAGHYNRLHLHCLLLVPPNVGFIAQSFSTCRRAVVSAMSGRGAMKNALV
ncbi:hypothetical protein BSLA_01f4249 [Burkholderia stabilis]|nr:hypothetical protein BSLA_01f4249 [Burkholderia stabilis]